MKSCLLILLFLGAIPNTILGYTYEHFRNSLFHSVHVLTVDPKEHTIRPVRANGSETVLELAQKYQARAAINGGFWKADGTPAGALKIDYQWINLPTQLRGAIGWTSLSHKVYIDQILTQTVNGTIEVIPVSNPPITTRKQWAFLENIVGGGPVIVQNGEAIQDFSAEKILHSFLFHWHRRTGVGIKESGEWVFVVVDGFGITIPSFAELMTDLGCIKALNLDGGRSSTLVIEGVVTSQCLLGAKAVSDAILIF